MTEDATKAHEADMAALAVCHDEQLVIWADEVMEAIEPWLVIESYDDKVLLGEALKHELRSIVSTAFSLRPRKI